MKTILIEIIKHSEGSKLWVVRGFPGLYMSNTSVDYLKQKAPDAIRELKRIHGDDEPFEVKFTVK